MMNKLHPLSFARKWVLSVGTVMTARACVGITITIEFGKQAGIVWLPGRGVCWNCKQGRLCPSLTVLFGHLLGQIVLSESLWNPWFMTAPMAVDKMSLVQITSPFFSLEGFLYDTFDAIIVPAHFCRNLRTISAPNIFKFMLPLYLVCLVRSLTTGYMIESIIIEIDTLPTAADTVGIRQSKTMT